MFQDTAECYNTTVGSHPTLVVMQVPAGQRSHIHHYIDVTIPDSPPLRYTRPDIGTTNSAVSLRGTTLMPHPRDGKYLYHLSSIENIPQIAAHGILSRYDLTRRRIRFVDIADSDILTKRQRYSLDRMVPFHFFVKNPFDYKVVFDNPDTHFCILAVSRLLAIRQQWQIITRHPLSGDEEPQLLDWDSGCQSIAWDQLAPGNRDYNDHACKMACMAEALSPHAVPLSDVSMIFVPDDHAARMLRAHILSSSPSIFIRPLMFPPLAR